MNENCSKKEDPEVIIKKIFYKIILILNLKRKNVLIECTKIFEKNPIHLSKSYKFVLKT